MVYSLTWLPEVLEGAGLKVAEVPGWRTRGRAEMGRVRGVMCHHTGTAKGGNMPTLNVLIEGRTAGPGSPALPGPLSQLGLGRDGTFYVIAAGRANHAGAGRWEGITTGNSSFIGIEAENSGTDADEWPPVQVDAYERGAAAILKRIDAEANMCCGHKEYAKGRKDDPTLDMAVFRNEVGALLVGKTPPPPIPSHDDQQRPTIRRGSKGDFVIEAQKALRVTVDGVFGAATEAAVRRFQRSAGLVPDGIIGPKSWAILKSAPPAVPVQPSAPGAPSTGLPLADDDAHPARMDGKSAVGPDGRRFASRVRSGFYTTGVTTLAEWLETVPAAPSTSVARVVKAMCVNEGGLEAINSYDGCHLCFGIFQWTAGPEDEPGELAALLAHLKAADAAAFHECFGRYKLDTRVANGSATTGRLVLDREVLRTSAQKDVLRDVSWAYRFWRAGHHEAVRHCQLHFAVSRINRFRNLTVAGRPLTDWITSELGVALLLDEHVNRPEHVPGTLATAIERMGVERSAQPTSWNTGEEHDLIDLYLAARGQTNMTDSDKRAGKIAHCVVAHDLSDLRHSFVS